jgi:hypothetical protein
LIGVRVVAARLFECGRDRRRWTTVTWVRWWWDQEGMGAD